MPGASLGMHHTPASPASVLLHEESKLLPFKKKNYQDQKQAVQGKQRYGSAKKPEHNFINAVTVQLLLPNF